MAKVLRFRRCRERHAPFSCPIARQSAVGRFRNRDFLGCRTEFAPYSRWVQSVFKRESGDAFQFFDVCIAKLAVTAS